MMRKSLLLFALACLPLVGLTQHPQRMVSALTACTTLDCIEQVQKKYKLADQYKPLSTKLNSTVSKYLFDYKYGDASKKGQAPKVYRLSLLLDKDTLLYGQLEQLNSANVVEATYLFVHQPEKINNFLQQQGQSDQAYTELIQSLVNRQPFLFSID